MIDLFSGWPEAFAVSNKDAETVAQLLFEEIIARHGCPRSITSDNGKEYCNHLVEKLTKNLNIHHIRTSPYHLQANGKTERFNRFLKDAMSKRINENQRDWDSHLSAVLMAYRMAVHDSTGFSPFLGGLSLHLNHLIASHTANYDWPFGTLPFGLLGSNLDTRDLETYPRTYSGHF